VSEFEEKAPQLLVSVRSVEEAEAALVGGCDVLDIKEPARGPLGMADVATIAAILAVRDRDWAAVPVSVALGEAAEWQPDRPIPRLPEGIAYLKLGTAGLAQRPDWPDCLDNIREQFDVGGAGKSHWIAVACADAEEAGGPPPEQVLDLAALGGWAGILIDTCSKESRNLFDWLDLSRLAALAAEARSRDLLFALAGRLQLEDVSRLAALEPDTVGIRSAACREGDRSGPIDAHRVRDFRSALRRSEPVGSSHRDRVQGRNR
jgi:uncharacterized protein (UPF0264 family)